MQNPIQQECEVLTSIYTPQDIFISWVSRWLDSSQPIGAFEICIRWFGGRNSFSTIETGTLMNTTQKNHNDNQLNHMESYFRPIWKNTSQLGLYFQKIGVKPIFETIT